VVPHRDPAVAALRAAAGRAIRAQGSCMKGISQFPTLLEAFFMDRLMRQRQASPHTIASYRDTFRLLMQHAQQQLRKAPSQLSLPDLDTPFPAPFLVDLDKNRTNSAL